MTDATLQNGNYLFAYGTLMRGQSRALDRMFDRGVAFGGEGALRHATLVLPKDAAWPALRATVGLLEGPTAPGVVGELWNVTSSVLAQLDTIEGTDRRHPLFARKKYVIDTEHGWSAHAWCYVWLWPEREWPTTPIGHSWRAFQQQMRDAALTRPPVVRAPDTSHPIDTGVTR